MTERDRIQAALPAYEIGVEVGRGAWGVVYSARHRSLHREVAIKQLPGAFAADPAVRTRFAHEARLAASLEHPHIVPVYDFLDSDSMCLIVMERCTGSLSDRFRSQGLATDEACAAMLSLCAGLAYAHGRQVLHRDLKPENLLYGSDDLLKLGDFGIARALDASTRLTATGTVMGTPAFMSPEQASGEDLTPASDIYSAGVIFYELLSGELPFGDLPSVGAMIKAHLTEPPRPLLSVAPQLPPSLVSVVDRAVAKSPAERFQSADEFGIAIGEAAAVAFGPGWLRQRRFPLMGAPEIIAATERDVGGTGRAGTVIVQGRTHEIEGVVDAAALEEPSAPTPTAAPVVGSPATASLPTIAGPETTSTAAPEPGVVFAPPPSHQPPVAPPPVPNDPSTWAPPTTPPGTPVPPSPSPQGPQGTSKSQNRGVLVVAAVAVLAVVGGLVAFLSGGNDDGDSSNQQALTSDDASSDAETGDGDPEAGNDQSDDSQAGGESDDLASSSDDAAGDEAATDGATNPPGDGLTIGAILSERESDEGASLTIQLAVDDVNDGGGVLGGSLELLQPGFSGLDSARFAADGASVIIGPGDPLDSQDAVGASGDSIVISYSDFFPRDFGPAEGFFTMRPRLEHPMYGIVERLVGDGPIVIVTGRLAVARNGDTSADIAAIVGEAGRESVVIDEGTPVKQVAGQASDIGATSIIFVGIINPSEHYQALFSAGITPDTAQFLAIGDDGWATGFDDGALRGIQGMTVDFLTGDALEARLPATNLNAEAAQAYDAVIVASLAAEAAGSSDPAAIAAMLPEVTAGGVVCTSFSECVIELRSGEDIDYDGPSGPIALSATDGRPNAALVRSTVAGDTILDDVTESIIITKG